MQTTRSNKAARIKTDLKETLTVLGGFLPALLLSRVQIHSLHLPLALGMLLGFALAGAEPYGVLGGVVLGSLICDHMYCDPVCRISLGDQTAEQDVFETIQDRAVCSIRIERTAARMDQRSDRDAVRRCVRCDRCRIRAVRQPCPSWMDRETGGEWTYGSGADHVCAVHRRDPSRRFGTAAFRLVLIRFITDRRQHVFRLGPRHVRRGGRHVLCFGARSVYKLRSEADRMHRARHIDCVGTAKRRKTDRDCIDTAFIRGMWLNPCRMN